MVKLILFMMSFLLRSLFCTAMDRKIKGHFLGGFYQFFHAGVSEERDSACGVLVGEIRRNDERGPSLPLLRSRRWPYADDQHSVDRAYGALLEKCDRAGFGQQRVWLMRTGFVRYPSGTSSGGLSVSPVG